MDGKKRLGLDMTGATCTYVGSVPGQRSAPPTRSCFPAVHMLTEQQTCDHGGECVRPRTLITCSSCVEHEPPRLRTPTCSVATSPSRFNLKPQSTRNQNRPSPNPGPWPQGMRESAGGENGTAQNGRNAELRSAVWGARPAPTLKPRGAGGAMASPRRYDWGREPWRPSGSCRAQNRLRVWQLHTCHLHVCTYCMYVASAQPAWRGLTRVILPPSLYLSPSCLARGKGNMAWMSAMCVPREVIVTGPYYLSHRHVGPLSTMCASVHTYMRAHIHVAMNVACDVIHAP